MKEKFESQLYKYFSDIVYVNENPCTIYTRDISKSGDELIIKESKDIYELKSILIDDETTNLFVPECKSGGILQKIKANSEIIFFNFYPKNIFQKIFNKNKKLHRLLEELINKEEYEFILTDEDIAKYLKNFKNVETFSQCDYQDCRVLNKIIVLGKRSKVIINQNIKSDEVRETLKNVEFWIDYSKFKVIKLA